MSAPGQTDEFWADSPPPDEPIYTPGLEEIPLRLSKDRRHTAGQFGLAVLFRLTTFCGLAMLAWRIDSGAVVVVIWAAAACLTIFAIRLVSWSILVAIAVLWVCCLSPVIALVAAPVAAIVVGIAAVRRWWHPLRPAIHSCGPRPSLANHAPLSPLVLGAPRLIS